MKYLVKQKMFSLADKFNIKDSSGKPIYRMDGKFLSIGKKINIYNMDGNHLIYIEQEAFKFLPEYFIYRKEDQLARVKKEFNFFRPKINIESIYGDFTIEGSVMRHNFTVKKDGKIVAEISKEFLSFTDIYEVDISGDEGDFLLTLVIVID